MDQMDTTSTIGRPSKITQSGIFSLKIYHLETVDQSTVLKKMSWGVALCSSAA
jgi:hypothetical protein